MSDGILTAIAPVQIWIDRGKRSSRFSFSSHVGTPVFDPRNPSLLLEIIIPGHAVKIDLIRRNQDRNFKFIKIELLRLKDRRVVQFVCESFPIRAHFLGNDYDTLKAMLGVRLQKNFASEADLKNFVETCGMQPAFKACQIKYDR